MMLFRFMVLVAVIAGLTSCANVRGSAALHPVAATAEVGTPVAVFAATTRKRSQTDKRDFTNERSLDVGYEAYTVSVPPNHVTGQIEWPRRLPGNPATSFVVTKSTSLDQAGFNRSVAQYAESGEVVVFVHGYNTNFQEAVFRAAQLKHDSRLQESMVAFAWPSLASLSGYLADRESSTYSRDSLERTLDNLARTPGIRRIHLLAHSMGNWLTMETLRQAKLRGKSAFLPKLGEVLLMSPDIDIDVFGTQLDAIGKLNPPITVAISRDDEALGVSQWLAGGVPRAGNVLIEDKDKEEAQKAVAAYGIRLIDMSDAKSPDAMRHGKFVNLLPALNQLEKDEERRGRGSSLSQAGLGALNAAGTLLLTPLHLGAAIVER